MSLAWPDVLRGVREADDGDRAKLPGVTSQEGGLNVVQSGGCGGVATDAPSYPERRGPGEPGGGTPPLPPGEAQTYRVSSHKLLLRLWCPVEGCLKGDSDRTNLRAHFVDRHGWDTIVILEEGNRP